MAKVVAIVNHKGGVSKTFIATNGADALAREGLNVLVVDLDPQGNATVLLHNSDDPPVTPLERVLAGQASIAEAVITTTRVPGVHLIGSTLKLSTLADQLQFSNPFNATRQLAEKLALVADAYDVILLDCPPSLGTMTANALACADMVVVPIESGAKLSLIGSDDILAFIRAARAANPKLAFGGAILTKHDGRKQVCRIVAGAVRASFDSVFEATLPESTDVKKGVLLNKTILQMDCDHTVSRSTVKLMRELIAKLGIASRAHVPMTEELAHAE
jgi:chromosome partitioning protein